MQQLWTRYWFPAPICNEFSETKISAKTSLVSQLMGLQSVLSHKSIRWSTFCCCFICAFKKDCCHHIPLLYFVGYLDPVFSRWLQIADTTKHRQLPSKLKNLTAYSLTLLMNSGKFKIPFLFLSKELLSQQDDCWHLWKSSPLVHRCFYLFFYNMTHRCSTFSVV